MDKVRAKLNFELCPRFLWFLLAFTLNKTKKVVTFGLLSKKSCLLSKKGGTLFLLNMWLLLNNHEWQVLLLIKQKCHTTLCHNKFVRHHGKKYSTDQKKPNSKRLTERILLPYCTRVPVPVPYPFGIHSVKVPYLNANNKLTFMWWKCQSSYLKKKMGRGL